MFCSRCGAQLADSSLFCSKCGAPVAAPAGPSEMMGTAPVAEGVSPKSRLAATLLACPFVMVGLFGAHRFYLGKTRTAVGMLILGVAALGCYAAHMVGFMTSTSEWEEDQPVPFWVLFLLLSGLFGVAVGIWALVDFIIAVTGKFKDKEGLRITRW